MKCRKLTKKAFRKTLMFGAFIRGLFNAFMSLQDVMYVASCVRIEDDIPHAKIIIEKGNK